MFHSLPDYIRSLPLVVINTVVIYIFLIAGFRIIGRRQLGQLTVIDLVVILIMGSAVETAMIGGNISLPAGLVCTATLLGTNRLIAALACRSKKFRRFVTGGPVLVIWHGHIIDSHLHRLGLTEADVLEALRGRGCCDLEDVSYAVMEDDGEISVVERGEKVQRSTTKLAEAKI